MNDLETRYRSATKEISELKTDNNNLTGKLQEITANDQSNTQRLERELNDSLKEISKLRKENEKLLTELKNVGCEYNFLNGVKDEKNKRLTLLRVLLRSYLKPQNDLINILNETRLLELFIFYIYSSLDQDMYLTNILIPENENNKLDLTDEFFSNLLDENHTVDYIEKKYLKALHDKIGKYFPESSLYAATDDSSLSNAILYITILNTFVGPVSHLNARELLNKFASHNFITNISFSSN